MQPTTVVSDGVLFLVTLALTVKLLKQKRSPDRVYGAIGILLTGLAALSGVIRYGLIESLEPLHAFLTAMAGQIGTPLLAMAFFHTRTGKLPKWNTWAAASVVFFVLMLVFQMAVPVPSYSIIIGGVAMLAILVMGLVSANVLAIAGAIIMMLAGLVIGTEGEWHGFLRLDLFHYTVSTGFAALGISLIKMRK